jgi:hypothetical protein
VSHPNVSQVDRDAIEDRGLIDDDATEDFHHPGCPDVPVPSRRNRNGPRDIQRWRAGRGPFESTHLSRSQFMKSLDRTTDERAIPDIAPPADDDQTADSTDLVRCDNCGRYGWHTTDRCPATPPDLAPPPWASFVDTWDSALGGGRVILGVDHAITDCDLKVSTSCVQHRDGHIDDGSTDECPRVYINQPIELNSDQARELAAVLLELAAQVDGWVAR